MQPSIDVERSDSVAVLRMSRDVTNALDPDLVRGLSESLGRIGRDPSLRALVLTSANDKFFSIGFDIPSLYPMGPDEFTVFYRSFNRLCIDLYSSQKPTVAALTGHAVAGGGILASCCDYRIIAEGHRLMGVNEVKLGVPMPYPADRIIRDLLGGRTARNVMDAGDFYPPEELLRMGWVDRVLPLADVIPKSIERALELGSLAPEGFSGIKRNRTEPVVAQVLSRLEEKERSFVDAWFSDAARARLEDAMTAFKR